MYILNSVLPTDLLTTWEYLADTKLSTASPQNLPVHYRRSANWSRDDRSPALVPELEVSLVCQRCKWPGKSHGQTESSNKLLSEKIRKPLCLSRSAEGRTAMATPLDITVQGQDLQPDLTGSKQQQQPDAPATGPVTR